MGRSRLIAVKQMEPFPYLAGSAGALVGGLQNVGSGVATWFSALLPQHNQFSLGMIDLHTRHQRMQQGSVE